MTNLEKPPISKETLQYDRKMKNIQRIQLIKTVPFLVLIIGLLFFQVNWFISLQELHITYDFSNYQVLPTGSNEFELPLNSSEPHSAQVINLNSTSDLMGEGADGFFQQVISYLTTNHSESLNFSQAENFTFQNATDIRYNVEHLLNTTLNSSQDLYLQFLRVHDANITALLYQYISAFMYDLWNNAVQQLIPDSWFDPAYLNITNEGDFIYFNLNFSGNFRWLNYSSNFLNYTLPIFQQQETLTLNITMADLMNSLLSIAIDALVNLTLTQLSVDPVGILRDFSTYMQLFFQQIEIFVDMHIGGVVGFLPVKIVLSVNISNFSKFTPFANSLQIVSTSICSSPDDIIGINIWKMRGKR